MQKISKKRFASIIAVLCIFAFAVQIYNSNSYLETNEVSLFKKNTTRSQSYQYVDKGVHYECGHSKVLEKEKQLDQPQQAFDESLYGTNDVSYLLPVEKEYKNIRIKVDYSNISTLSLETRQYIVKKVFPAVVSYIQAVIKVQRLTQPIKVDPAYKGKTCGQGKIKIPDEHFDGVQDTDLVFYVSHHSQDTNLLAYSSYCPQGQNYGLSSGRPTVAYMSYNLKQLEKDISSNDKMVLAKWIYMTTHELVHSLVFSPNYYDKYLLEKNPVKIIGGKPYVVAPSVIKVAKEYYGCPTVDKVALEDAGGATTFGFHWERRYFGNEIMTGSFLYDSILSKFTAAMFRASGWYEVDDSLLAELTWGIGEKCEFLVDSCPKNTKEFCTMPGKRCNFDYIGQGVCSDSDILSNKCSYFQPSKTQHCTYPDEESRKIYEVSGGTWGPNARCFDTDIAASSNVSSVCYDAYCDFKTEIPTVIFKVFNKEYVCDNKTKEVEIPGKGKIKCPDITRFCTSIAACPLSCAGKGVCQQGKCKCFDGFKGDDCTQSV
ncbi:leishmanolysin family protein (macronuclear) [Tetrahymena thermophila SB210]|uniref:Leishmanolysin family protein n=1 Tax=Tetrahymena thermophila (strain SB210) TaxID=312017 RepID=I7MG89_TETTS|nr:leishmanolysin family protein [Tetrahymena thermophila SB210]EAS01241.1 leishmanolysin family protein [Tetrahymena thermophila SB210]|eukprot:XP_001021486.1 leishmanolysin family protein [Tetrahymena thermophila SB210]